MGVKKKKKQIFLPPFTEKTSLLHKEKETGAVAGCIKFKNSIKKRTEELSAGFVSM